MNRFLRWVIGIPEPLELVHGWSKTITRKKLNAFFEIRKASLNGVMEATYDIMHKDSLRHDKNYPLLKRTLDCGGFTEQSFFVAISDHTYFDVTQNVLSYAFNTRVNVAFIREWLPRIVNSGVSEEKALSVFIDALQRNNGKLAFKYVHSYVQPFRKWQPVKLIHSPVDTYLEAIESVGYKEFVAFREAEFGCKQIKRFGSQGIDSALAIALRDGAIV